MYVFIVQFWLNYLKNKGPTFFQTVVSTEANICCVSCQEWCLSCSSTHLHTQLQTDDFAVHWLPQEIIHSADRRLRSVTLDHSKPTDTERSQLLKLTPLGRRCLFWSVWFLFKKQEVCFEKPLSCTSCDWHERMKLNINLIVYYELLRHSEPGQKNAKHFIKCFLFNCFSFTFLGLGVQLGRFPQAFSQQAVRCATQCLCTHCKGRTKTLSHSET